MRRWSLFVVALFSLAGCKELDKALNTADAALGVVNSKTARSLHEVARSDDPRAALKAGLTARGELYKKNPQLLVQDVRQVKRDFDRLMGLLKGHVGEQWGDREVKVAGKTEYVKYTQNYESRAIVDFDRGVITVETVDGNDARTSLKNAIVTTLLTPDDPRSVDLFSASEVKLESDRQPYLLGLVEDRRGRSIDTPARAEAYSDYLLANKVRRRPVEVGGQEKRAHYVTIMMVSNFSNRQAEKYRDLVEKYAERHAISPSLVYSMIRTESNFNPFAVSSAPAYGLMQLVPGSGGREAYRHVKGEDVAPGKEYLFDPENNIELGTALLNVLFYKQLGGVENAVSREYCVISAYNTGAGNVLRAFAPKNERSRAINAINSLEPPQVYRQLREKLPYAETRRYLYKVTSYRKEFLRFN